MFLAGVLPVFFVAALLSYSINQIQGGGCARLLRLLRSTPPGLPRVATLQATRRQHSSVAAMVERAKTFRQGACVRTRELRLGWGCAAVAELLPLKTNHTASLHPVASSLTTRGCARCTMLRVRCAVSGVPEALRPDADHDERKHV